MRLIDHEHADLDADERVDEPGRRKALGRDVEKPQPPLRACSIASRFDAGVLLAVDQRRAPAAVAFEARDLVGHQRDERRDDDREVLAHQRRELVAERLAGARRHDHQDVAPGQRGPHRILLTGAERGESEVLVERVAGRDHRADDDSRPISRNAWCPLTLTRRDRRPLPSAARYRRRASDLDATLELARAAARGGTTDVVATPHVNATWPNTPERIGVGVQELRRQLAEHEIPLRIHAGAEVALTWAMERSDGELARLTLGGGPWLLVEPPHTSRVIGLDGLLVRLQHRGHRIILAHVERCPTFLADREMLARLVDAGMLTSVTAGSLVGRFGGRVQRFTHDLLNAGLVHNVASDAHDVRGRPPGISGELERAGLEERRSWLTVEVPRALLGGAPIPIAPAWPASHQRRGLRALLRR